MKIAYLSCSAIPSRAANSIHVVRMCHAFAQNGNEVTLYVPALPGREKIDGSIFEYYGVQRNFKIVTLPWLPIKGRSTIYGILAAIGAKVGGVDVVYGRDLKSCYFSVVMRIPVVYETHAPDTGSDNAYARIYKKMITNQFLRRQVVISEALLTIYGDGYPDLGDKQLVAHDGADEIPESVEDILEDKAQIHIGYVGQLYRGRGIGLIIELAQRCSWADFHIIGGMDEDIQYWRNLASSAKNIHFYGFMPYSDAEKYRCSCDILVAPFEEKVNVFAGGGDTSAWMSPLKMFEYMSAGKAIVCTNFPVIREVLEHDVTALLCEPNDIDAWIRALESLRLDENYRKKLGSTAREIFKDKYTWSRRAKNVLEGLT
ncbi:MAG TPA: glycosyltransferase [Gammaproteobacteria bacterium]|nr:glycosyltransferase [Gammaproteobacteria bacterium]